MAIAAIEAGVAGAVARRVSEEAEVLAQRVASSVVAVHSGRAGSGSGVLWPAPAGAAQPLVVTNHHVISGDRAIVAFADGSRREALVIALDAMLDLAVLRLADEPLPHGAQVADVGSSSALRPGELVLAVGHPLGEKNAATLGVFAARRKVSPHGVPGELLQVAITLRPGNSGGALADARGRVVGIPNMVNGPGLGLAVPSDTVVAFLTDGLQAITPRDGVIWV